MEKLATWKEILCLSAGIGWVFVMADWLVRP